MLFFNIEDRKKYLYFKRKKFTLSLSFVPLAVYFFLLPIATLFIKTDIFVLAGILLMFLVYVFGMWMAIEGIIMNRKIGYYRRKGKKIEFEFGKGISGVKVYK
ncbi:MAG: hypothetical protein ABH864_04735 [archaeon]